MLRDWQEDHGSGFPLSGQSEEDLLASRRRDFGEICILRWAVTESADQPTRQHHALMGCGDRGMQKTR